ncbi:hypothetical protein KUCAC02_033120 [Chaenocephalus aceratus]|nr:hypothetical protein KUCAC02_033120 [Chaenocephalus aceratus]
MLFLQVFRRVVDLLHARFGTLLPWNFYMNATVYFTSRLKDSPLEESSANQTEAPGERSAVSQRLRVLGSLLVIMFVFIATAVFVRVPLEPLAFFCVTMAKIVTINSFGAVLQGSLFGMAGLLPASYTTPVMSGQGMAGSFAAFAMICAIASGSDLPDAAFGYFITACVVIFLSILCYILLPKLEFFQFYQEKNRKPSPENSVILMNPEGDGESADQSGQQDVSVVKIFKKIWLLALSVCFTFTVTIGTFPAITADTKSTLARGSWERYFIPPRSDSRILPVSIVSRLVFPPLFMLCNVRPRQNLPVFFLHDGWFILFMVLFAFSNGYLASLCMCFGPKYTKQHTKTQTTQTHKNPIYFCPDGTSHLFKVPAHISLKSTSSVQFSTGSLKVLPHEAETAGVVMAFFLSLGLALGAGLSFLLRALV